MNTAVPRIHGLDTNRVAYHIRPMLYTKRSPGLPADKLRETRAGCRNRGRTLVTSHSAFALTSSEWPSTTPDATRIGDGLP